MPRKPRFFLPDIPVHIVQRGHSREPVFFEDGDYRAYLDWLSEAAERFDCAIHAYVLMTNHIHILATPRKSDSVSRMMQYVGRRYVPYINYTYGTSGTGECQASCRLELMRLSLLRSRPTTLLSDDRSAGSPPAPASSFVFCLTNVAGVSPVPDGRHRDGAPAVVRRDQDDVAQA